MTPLFELIGYIETKNKLQSIRFEPVVYEHIAPMPRRPNVNLILDRIQRIHACSRSTALVVYSSSWGAIQLMGFNLYETESYNKSVFDFVNSFEDQQAQFMAFLVKKSLDKFDSDVLASDADARKHFATVYNGSTDYVAPMIDALRHYGHTIL